jgi:hypothetical protein
LVSVNTPPKLVQLMVCIVTFFICKQESKVKDIF